ncbi:MAG: hypothetical protein ACR2HJ_09400 [Fimbriimonadales bacterium]
MPDLFNHIHDLWFDLDEILEQKGDSRVFRLWRSTRETTAEPTYLTIGDVIAVEVNDTEGIRFYDINILRYKGGELTVLTGVPLTLKLRVGTLSAEVRYSGPEPERQQP